MNAKVRRRLEMGRSALHFNRAHPYESPGFVAAMAKLEGMMSEGETLGQKEGEAVRQVRASTVRKIDLKREMKRTQLAHVVKVAKVASRDVPELAQRIRLPRGITTHLAFETAARSIVAEVQANKELLVKHGLVEEVLESLVAMLDQFSAALQKGTEGRRAHVGASAELNVIASEIVQVVNAMDGVNRFRFEGDAELLAAWESASSVQATPKPAAVKPTAQEPLPPGGDVRPAA